MITLCEFISIICLQGPRLKLMKAVRLMTESRIHEDSQKIELQQQQQQQQQSQQQQKLPHEQLQQSENVMMMEHLHQGQHPQQHFTNNSGFVPPHGPHHHPQMQMQFPPSYDHVQQQQQQQQHQRFNFVPQAIRPSHAVIDNPPPPHSQFQAAEFMNQIPAHSLGHIVPPGTMPQGPAFPVMYQESPAYFFYQQ